MFYFTSQQCSLIAQCHGAHRQPGWDVLRGVVRRILRDAECSAEHRAGKPDDPRGSPVVVFAPAPAHVPTVPSAEAKVAFSGLLAPSAPKVPWLSA